MKQRVFLRKFDPTLDYVAAKTNFSAGGKQIPVGEKIDKDSFSTRRLRQLYEWRRIAPVIREKDLTKAVKHDNVSSVEIKKSSGPAPWFTVYKDGEKIGKSFRHEKEAQEFAAQHA